LAAPVTTAHECDSPAAMAVTPEVRPETWTGVVLSVVVLLPSWPDSFLPQQ
jgi:hypothetical protein